MNPGMRITIACALICTGGNCDPGIHRAVVCYSASDVIRQVIVLILLSLPSHAATLWYNGDWNGVTGLGNAKNYQFADAWVYDDFTVPAAGWTISGVFSNDFFSATTLPASVFWEIRSGVSTGSGGTLIASGTTTPTITPTGRTLGVQTEDTITAGGLAVALAAGQYWLAVVPVGSGSGANPFLSGTTGANCIGSPCGNDGNAFYYEPSNAALQFVPTTTFSPRELDFSMGVIGTAAPEPATIVGLGIGFLLIGLIARRRST